MHVLIADDEPDVLRAYARVARSAAHHVEICPDGGRALKLLSQRSFSLAVLDIKMPILDGLEVCRQLRRRGDMTPILILSGLTDKKSEIDALTAGADDFVTKDAGPAVFRAHVSALLRRTVLAARKRWSLGRATLEEDGRVLRFHGTGEQRNVQTSVKLSVMEARVLTQLAGHVHETVSREELILSCWGQDATATDNALAAVIARLRRRVKGSGLIIGAIRSRGLQLDLDYMIQRG